jgi:hypothetical protein
MKYQVVNRDYGNNHYSFWESYKNTQIYYEMQAKSGSAQAIETLLGSKWLYSLKIWK